MSASDHLHPTLFHGSHADLDVGDTLLPSSQVGHSPYADLYAREDSYRLDGASRGDHVFMLPTEDRAWRWTALGAEDDDWPEPWLSRSPKVFEVQPDGGAHTPESLNVPGGELIDGERVTQAGKGAKIVGVHYSRVGEQGQIPGYNWEAQNANSYRNSRKREAALRDADPVSRMRKYREEHRVDLSLRGVRRSFPSPTPPEEVIEPRLPGFDHFTGRSERQQSDVWRAGRLGDVMGQLLENPGKRPVNR